MGAMILVIILIAITLGITNTGQVAEVDNDTPVAVELTLEEED